jgi:hypothetical protein
LAAGLAGFHHSVARNLRATIDPENPHAGQFTAVGATPVEGRAAGLSMPECSLWKAAETATDFSGFGQTPVGNCPFK